MEQEMIKIPATDVWNLDEVVRELGIEESETTPAEAVKEIKAELAAANRNARDLADAAERLLAITPSERQDPRIWFARVDGLKLAIKVARGEIPHGSSAALTAAEGRPHGP